MGYITKGCLGVLLLTTTCSLLNDCSQDYKIKKLEEQVSLPSDDTSIIIKDVWNTMSPDDRLEVISSVLFGAVDSTKDSLEDKAKSVLGSYGSKND